MATARSKWQIYSIGIAASNKGGEDDRLLVLPIETSPYGEGELKGGIEPDQAEGVDAEGKSYTVEVSTDNSVEADWAQIGSSNRATAPDVRRGERVMLYRHADSESLWWDSMNMDHHLRKLETVIWTFSATQDETVDSNTPENSYSFEVSTHSKQITLRTVKADGEPFAYTFQFNTKDGGVTLTDDVGNLIELDSAETTIRLLNKLGTLYEAVEEDLNMYAPGNINVEALKNIAIEAGQSISMRAKQNVAAKAGQNASVEGGLSAVLKSGGSAFTLTPSGGTISAANFDVVKG